MPEKFPYPLAPQPRNQVQGKPSLWLSAGRRDWHRLNCEWRLGCLQDVADLNRPAGSHHETVRDFLEHSKYEYKPIALIG